MWFFLYLFKPKFFWFGFANTSKMIFSYTLPTSLTSSKAFWISTQVPTGPTTIAMFFLFVSFTLLLTIRSARFFMNPVCIFCTLLLTLRWDILCSALSHCSGSTNIQVRVSSCLSSNNLWFTMSDLHLSLIFFSKFAPKLQYFPPFLNPVSNYKTVLPSFCWGWWHFWRAEAELTREKKYPFNAVTVAGIIVFFANVHEFREDFLDMWAC